MLYTEDDGSIGVKVDHPPSYYLDRMVNHAHSVRKFSSAASEDTPPDWLSGLMQYGEGLFSSVGMENEINRTFNAQQAQLQRSFNERMSNTAYTRATADLRNAGLNPLLAITGGGSSSATAGQSYGSAASYNSGGGDTLTSLINAVANTANAVAQFLPNISKVFSQINSTSNSTTNNTNHNYNYKGK